jgi:uncharacterized tellurite resistance protein B-like protein
MYATVLSEPEQVVLLALVGMMARADGTLTEPEIEVLEMLRAEIGPGRFEKVRDAAAALDGDQAIFEQAATITRPEARQAIYGVVFGMAVPDTISQGEGELLRRLAKLWDLEAL